MIDNFYSKVFIMLISISLFYAVNPIVALIGFVAAVELIRRSSLDNRFNLTNQLPAEDKRTYDMMTMNQFPNTLEEEMVKNMNPVVQADTYLGDASYKPVLEDDNNASIL
jgi:hypothetical protein